jgi:hypothetical protein
MYEEQLKTRIFIMLSVDWLMYLAATGLGVYSVLYSENPEFMGLAALALLLIVSKLGDWIRSKAARLKMELEKHKRELAKNFN